MQQAPPTPSRIDAVDVLALLGWVGVVVGTYQLLELAWALLVGGGLLLAFSMVALLVQSRPVWGGPPRQAREK